MQVQGSLWSQTITFFLYTKCYKNLNQPIKLSTRHFCIQICKEEWQQSTTATNCHNIANFFIYLSLIPNILILSPYLHIPISSDEIRPNLTKYYSSTTISSNFPRSWTAFGMKMSLNLRKKLRRNFVSTQVVCCRLPKSDLSQRRQLSLNRCAGRQSACSDCVVYSFAGIIFAPKQGLKFKIKSEMLTWFLT